MNNRPGMHSSAIAIVTNNMLTSIGLQQVLEDIIPMVDVKLFDSFENLLHSDPEKFIHFFVDSMIYIEHTQFFREQGKKTIVLIHGNMNIQGMITLNVCQSEHMLIKSILELHGMGHAKGDAPDPRHIHGVVRHTPSQTLLSAREVEVAVLLSKGLINKEIAEKLNISITTVISHRKNIMDKLNAKSLADIIIYSVVNGLVRLGDL